MSTRPRLSLSPALRGWQRCARAHVLLFLLAFVGSAVAEGPRHVFLIVIDTLRADHLGAYGYTRDTSPYIDSLAREGVLFEHAYAASSFTRESIAAILGGAWPTASGSGAGWEAHPAPGVETLPEMFRRAGFATAFYSDTPMLEHAGFARGFDEAAGMMEYGRSLLGTKVLAKAKSFLEKNAGRDTFIYLHLLDPHSPYDPPEEYLARIGAPGGDAPEVIDARAALSTLTREGFGPGEARFEAMVAHYDAEIAYQDDLLKGFAGWLRETGRLAGTTIALTADHGEEFLEHGYLEHAWHLYPEVIRVPLVFWSGAGLPPARVPGRVSNVGIFPTLAALLGIPPRPEAFAVGPLLAQTADGGWIATAQTAPIIAELQLPERNMLRVVIAEDSLYVAAQQWLRTERLPDAGLHAVQRRLREEYRTGVRKQPGPWDPVVHEALYDLKADPRCLADIATTDLERLGRLRGLLGAYRAACGAGR